MKATKEEVVTKTFTLTLSEAEAKAIREMIGTMSHKEMQGFMSSNRRDKADLVQPLYKALNDAIDDGE